MVDVVMVVEDTICNKGDIKTGKERGKKKEKKEGKGLEERKSI